LKDYYVILGLQRGASPRDIKRAYRKLVKKWHPDFHPGDPSCARKIQEINEAYEVLSDRGKRRAYDQWGEDWKIASLGQTAFRGAQEEHPFFSYFLRVSQRTRRKEDEQTEAPKRMGDKGGDQKW